MPVSHINTAIKNCLWVRERVQHLYSFCPKKNLWEPEKSLPYLATEPETNNLSALLTFSETLQVLKGQCLQNYFWHIIKWNMSTSVRSWEFPCSPGGFSKHSKSLSFSQWIQQRKFQVQICCLLDNWAFFVSVTYFLNKNSYLEILSKGKQN